MGERLTIFEAVEKQLGLKLEEKAGPLCRFLSCRERVNQKPAENPLQALREAFPPTRGCRV